MECEEFFVCFSIVGDLIVLGHNQWFVVVVDRHQEEPSFTLTVKWEGMISAGGVNIVTRVVTAHTLTRWYLLIDGLALWRTLQKEGGKINLKSRKKLMNIKRKLGKLKLLIMKTEVFATNLAICN